MAASYVPIEDVIAGAWPHALGTSPDMGQVFDAIGIAGAGLSRDGKSGLPNGASFELAVLDQVVLDLPILPGFELHTGKADGTITPFTATISADPHLTIGIRNLPVTLHLPPNILQRWTFDGSAWHPDLDLNGQAKGFDFVLNTGISIDLEDEIIALDAPTIVDPGANVGAMIGNTGVIVTISNLQLILSDTPPDGQSFPANLPLGFRGVWFDHVTATFVKDDSALPIDQSHPGVVLNFNDCAIGSGGFSGQIEVVIPPAADRDTLPGGKLFGIDCRLQKFDVTFAGSIPTASSIQAYLQLPFFSDPATAADWLALDIAFGGPDGELLARLSDATHPGDLVHVHREGLFDLNIAALAFHAIDGVPGIEISGSLQPLIAAGFDWPVFALDGLRVDRKGRIQMADGLLRLPKAEHIELDGFSVELSAIGFGDFDEGSVTRSFFALSGGIKLTDDLAGAEVKNLRVSWPKGISPADLPSNLEVSLDGVEVDLTFDGVLSIAGAVAYDHTNKEFSGQLELTLEKPVESSIGVDFIIGQTAGGQKYWFLSALLDLPVGIPVAETGVSLYGGEILIGQNWAPNKTPQQDWFDDWYLGGPVAGLGVSPPATPRDKWTDHDGAWVFGLGPVIGTTPDDGFSTAAKALLVLTFPGPNIFIVGDLQYLKPRSNLETHQPPFRMVAILDFEHGEFLIGAAAHYVEAHIIDVNARAEAYFNLHNRSAWRLSIGKPPEPQRVQAVILSLVRASSYFVLDAHGLATGASVSWGYDLSVGPLGIHIRAGLDEGVDIFWQPFQLAGFVELQGNAGLSAFGISISLSIDASLQAQAPKPYQVAGTFHVELDTPWPLPNLEADVSFSWTQSATPDYWINPLNSVTLISPLASVATAWTATTDQNSAPSVPIDAHPLITLGHPVNPGRSVAGIPPAISVAQPGTLGFVGERLPGVPGNFVSSLTAVTLERFDGASWQTVAQSENPSAPWNGSVNLNTAVWGTWMDIKDRNGDWAAMQFELFNRYGFSRHDNLGSPSLGAAVADYGAHICSVNTSVPRRCTDFTDQAAGTIFGPLLVHAPGTFTTNRTIGIAARADVGAPRVLFLQPATQLTLSLDEPCATLDLDLVPYRPVTVTSFSGSTQLSQQSVATAAVVRLQPTAGSPITSVRIDTLSAGVPTLLPYRNDAILYDKPAFTNWQEPRDCVRFIEQILVQLLQPASDQVSALGTVFTQLNACVAGTPCRTQVAALQNSATKYRAVASSTPAAGHALFQQVAKDALAAARCILQATQEQSAACPDLAQAAIAAEDKLINLAADAARAPNATARATALRSLDAAIVEARLARQLLSICLQTRGGGGIQIGPGTGPGGTGTPGAGGGPPGTPPVPTEIASIVVGVGDPNNTSLWLAQIPGLSGPVRAGGCDIRRLCWTTAAEAALGGIAHEMHDRFDDIVRQSSADAPILVPHSQYRLTVGTQQSNPSVSGSPRSWTETRYFNTAGPPGDYLVGAPLDSLAPYLKATIPADKATGVYCDYGFGVVFNVAYVDAMYAATGENLQLHLLGPDNQPITDSSGAAVVLQNAWSRAPTTTLQPYQGILAALGPTSDCALAPPVYQADAMSVAPLPAGVHLAPLTRHSIAVRAGASGAERDMFTFAFTTGRYADFAAQIADMRATNPIAAVTAGGAGTVGSMLVAQAPYDAKAEDLAYRLALGNLDLLPRLAPPRGIATRLRIAGSESVLLVEFSQPVDFRRIGITMYLDADSTAPLPAAGSTLAATLAARSDWVSPVVLRSGDGLGLLLAAADRRDLSGMRISLSFTFSMTVLDAVAFPDVPPLLHKTATAESAAVTFAFVMPS